MSISSRSDSAAVRLVSEVHLGRASDIYPLLSSWPQVLLLTSITIGTGMLPENERRARQVILDTRLAGCRCRESGLGMALGAVLYGAVWVLLPGLRTSNAWGDLLVGVGVSLLAGAVGRMVGHVLSRLQLRADLRALQSVITHAQ